MCLCNCRFDPEAGVTNAGLTVARPERGPEKPPPQ
jgi:hypothetical protein